VDVIRVRFLAVILGGALIGLAGAAYTLDLKQGWTYRHTAGVGWIALAIVIFGAWKAYRITFGCYLYAALLTIASRMQGNWDIPTQVLQVAPFVAMIVVLALVNSLSNPSLATWIATLPTPVQRVFAFVTSPAPASLGKPFKTS
jgi:simple sugar transport system permease protein